MQQTPVCKPSKWQRREGFHDRPWHEQLTSSSGTSGSNGLRAMWTSEAASTSTDFIHEACRNLQYDDNHIGWVPVLGPSLPHHAIAKQAFPSLIVSQLRRAVLSG